jgi:hypothetical protein
MTKYQVSTCIYIIDNQIVDMCVICYHVVESFTFMY